MKSLGWIVCMPLMAAYVFAPSWAVAGTTIDVAPGADINTLTSSLREGDIVRFSDGVYEIDDTLTWNHVGQEGNPITLKAADGARPVIRLIEPGWIVRMSDAAYVNIEGLTFEGTDIETSGDASALVLERVSNINIKDCIIHDKNGHGIYMITADRVLVEHTEIYNIFKGYHGIYLDGGIKGGTSYYSSFITLTNNWIHNLTGSNSSGIVFSSFVSDSEISDSVIHSSENRGIYLGTFTDGPANRVERNVVFNVASAGIEAHGTAVIANNIIFNSNGYGIYSTPSKDDDDYQISLVNNTVAATLNRAVFYQHNALDTHLEPQPFRLVNNALCSPLTYAFKTEKVTESNATMLQISNNFACGLVETYEGLLPGFQPGAGYADFVEAATWNFWPSSSSYLIDAGSGEPADVVPDLDFNGLERSGAPEVGAYERLYNDNPGWVIAEGFKSLEVDLPETDVPVETGCQGCKSSSGTPAVFGPSISIMVGIFLMRRRRQGHR